MPINLSGNVDKGMRAYIAYGLKQTSKNTNKLAEQTSNISKQVETMPKALIAQNNALTSLQNKISEKTNNNYRIGDIKGAIEGKYDWDFTNYAAGLLKDEPFDSAFGEDQMEERKKEERKNIIQDTRNYLLKNSSYFKDNPSTIDSAINDYAIYMYEDGLSGNDEPLTKDEFIDIYTKLGDKTAHQMFEDYREYRNQYNKFSDFYKDYSEAAKDEASLLKLRNQLYDEAKELEDISSKYNEEDN